MNAAANVSNRRAADWRLSPCQIAEVLEAGEVPSLRYPLTKKSLSAAFSALAPEGIRVTRMSGRHEAEVDGEWALSRLISQFSVLGFKSVGKKDMLLFVNDEQTVGLRLQGVRPNPRTNTWRTFSIEVEARPLSAVGLVPARNVLRG
jgi:hypothetical protein